MIQNLVFDLDGTLFDSLASIEESAHVAVRRVLPDMPPPDLKNLVGPPISIMFRKLWPDLPEEKMVALLAEFRDVYDSTGCLDAVPYPSVAILLNQLHRQGLRLFVLTNKPEKPTLAILEHHGLINLFTEVCCPDSTVHFTHKRLGAQSLAERHELLPETTALIGDGSDDAESAHLCGFRFFHAIYGYGRLHHAEGFTRLENFASLQQILNPSLFR